MSPYKSRQGYSLLMNHPSDFQDRDSARGIPPNGARLPRRRRLGPSLMIRGVRFEVGTAGGFPLLEVDQINIEQRHNSPRNNTYIEVAFPFQEHHHRRPPLPIPLLRERFFSWV